MYENWTFERWETPVSDLEWLGMVALYDRPTAKGGTLSITLEGLVGAKKFRYRFDFNKVAAYRNILEEYRCELWTRMKGRQQQLGSTYIVPRSPWLREFARREPLLKVENPKCRHYIVATEDDVVEVLCNTPPTIVKLTGAWTGRATKSTVYYVERGTQPRIRRRP